VEVWQTSNLRRLRLGEEKRNKKEEETTGQNNGLPYSIRRPKAYYKLVDCQYSDAGPWCYWLDLMRKVQLLKRHTISIAEPLQNRQHAQNP